MISERLNQECQACITAMENAEWHNLDENKESWESHSAAVMKNMLLLLLTQKEEL